MMSFQSRVALQGPVMGSLFSIMSLENHLKVSNTLLDLDNYFVPTCHQEWLIFVLKSITVLILVV